MKLFRTKYIDDIEANDLGKNINLQGFVSNVRDIGKIIFVEMRDRTSLLQLVFDDETPKEIFEKGKELRSEFVIGVSGSLREKELSADNSKNKKTKISKYEMQVKDLEIYSKANTPPIYINDNDDVSEDLRLKYRFLDLRKLSMQNKFLLRSEFLKVTRDFFNEEGFIELDTPILVKPTPEGARDYIVPSRVNKGNFYALPQSPQLYKQLFMVSGFDKYFQIAKCFRDEDLRADRQPEFTQIDLEMSFINEEMIIDVQEKFLKRIFKKILDLDVSTPFPRITYDESMRRFGTDRPDTRFGFEINDISEIVKDSSFKVFSEAVKNNGIVAGINFSQLNDKISRKRFDKLTEEIKTFNAKGLLYLRNSDENTSSFKKFVTGEEEEKIINSFNSKKGDVVLIVCGDSNVVYQSLSYLRLKIAEENNSFNKDDFNFIWVTDFPLFEKDEETGKNKAIHHPFTSPKIGSVEELKKSDPLKLLSRAYDIVLNGIEIGGGSIRINDPEIQSEIFNILGLSEEEMKEKFGFLLDAFKFGVPPHGGLAYGLDRLLMLMLRETSIREIIPFPKNQNAICPMTLAPSKIDESELKELGIDVKDK